MVSLRLVLQETDSHARLTSILARGALFCVAAFSFMVGDSVAQISVAGSGGEVDRQFGEFTLTGQAAVYRFAPNTLTTVVAVAVQSSGKPVIAGICGANPSEDMCVARLQIDGTQLDSSFAVNGINTIVLAGQDYVRSMVIDAQDRIYLTGYCNGLGQRACVHRLSANGVLDPSFGTAGRSVFSGMVEVNAIKIDADGKAVGVGECLSGGTSRMCVARLTESGAMDSGFNGGAVVQILPAPASSATASHALIDAANRVVLTGYCSVPTANGARYRFCAARVNTTGSIDTNFGVGGSRTWAMVSADNQAVSVQIAETSDGGLLVVGTCTAQSDSVQRMCTSKLTGNGNFDLSYGYGSFAGQSIQIFGGELSPSAPQLLIDGQGRALITFNCATPGRFCFVRLLPNGRPDPTFGLSGIQSFQPEPGVLGRPSAANASVWLTANRWLSGGVCPRTDSSFLNRGCVTRHYLDQPPGERCSLDLDGNGVLDTATDGLLWARLLMGFRGTRLTDGAVATDATRSSPAAIEAHLVNHCGLR